MAVLAALVVGLGVVTVPTATQAAPPAAPVRPGQVDRTLGNGLGRLLAPGRTNDRRRAGGFRVDQESLVLRDPDGRVLVDLTPRAGVDRTAFRRDAEAAGLQVRSVDATRGTIEG